jgi:hypothetical protein
MKTRTSFGFGNALTAAPVVGLLMVACAAGFLFAQSPPLPTLPPAPELRPVKILWDPQPASEYYHAFDTNGNFVGITYRVYNASNVTGPWTVVATTTNLSATISNLTARTQFFYVTASNFFFGERGQPNRVDPAGQGAAAETVDR